MPPRGPRGREGRAAAKRATEMDGLDRTRFFGPAGPSRARAPLPPSPFPGGGRVARPAAGAGLYRLGRGQGGGSLRSFSALDAGEAEFVGQARVGGDGHAEGTAAQGGVQRFRALPRRRRELEGRDGALGERLGARA